VRCRTAGRSREERHRTAEGTADQHSPVDGERVHRLQDIEPRCLQAGLQRGIAEARQVERHRPSSSGGERFQVLGPHTAIRDARMQQHDRRARAQLVIREDLAAA
jgi:hypothetical protein